MTETSAIVGSFAYRAQTLDGRPLSGSIDAASREEATRQLESLQLRVLEIEPAGGKQRGGALRGDDFVAFNQQLAHLAAAGLPLERGLRLIAEDIGSGRLAGTIREVAGELEAGRDLGEVFEARRGRFPSSYGRLLAAGVKSGNLSGVLFGLVRHLELTRRLRAALWRAGAYPLMVLVTLAGVVFYLGGWVLPVFGDMLEDMSRQARMYASFRSRPVQLPRLTDEVIAVAGWLPVGAGVVLVCLALAPIIWIVARRLGWDGELMDRLVMRLPLIGPVLKRSMVAEWCDAMRAAVDAGMDVPGAVHLAGDATPSPALRRDGEALVAAMERGEAIDHCRGRVLPAMVVAGMGLAMQQNDLPAALRGLSEMYQQQAEARLAALPAVLMPVLIVLMAGTIGVVLLAMFLPMVEFLNAVLSWC